LQLEKSTKGGGRQEMRGKSGNEEEVGCQTRNTANLPYVVLVSCGKTGCLLGSKSEKSEKEGNSRKKREIDGKAVKTSSRAAAGRGVVQVAAHARCVLVQCTVPSTKACTSTIQSLCVVSTGWSWRLK
jgi:hypothetical protein